MVQRCAYPLVLLALAAARPARPAEQPPPQPIIAYLNEVVRWYHEQGAVELLSGDPGDVVFADGVRRNARQVLQLAFVFARADAVLEPSPSAPANGAAGGGQGLTAMARRVDEASAAVERAQADVDALQRQLSQATAADRPLLGERLAEARGELQLATVRKDTLAGMAEFASEAGLGGGGGLLGQIDELQRAVPESTSQGAPPAPVPTQPTASRPAEGGIAALTAQAVGLGQKVRQLRGDEALTARLREDSRKLTTPLAGTLRGTLQAADQLEQAPATDDPATLKERIQSLAELTSRFKAVSSALVPLGKVNLLLDAHRANLAQWRAAVNAQFDSALWTLLLHLAFLAAAIAAILVASGFWRRATFRYVRDPRRRQQSLLLRRIVVTAAVLLMVVFSVATELGSVATFAGFLTAGMAVALQNVILSVAAYFFLIGKYGIRVGDRVQITGVTGDVMDIGLVRLHLMEIGPDALPTGRVVVFSNAVLFQPTANFFKQIPGSDFAWHQLTLTLAPDTDYRYAEERLMEAVRKVFGRYRDRIARQHREMTQNVSLPVNQPGPQSQIRLTQTGLEMTIRFPVPLEAIPAADDEVTRALLDAVDREPRLKLVGSGTPNIQSTPAPAGA